MSETMTAIAEWLKAEGFTPFVGGLYTKKISDSVAVRVEVGDWWLRRSMSTTKQSVAAPDVLAAADLIRRVGEAALAEAQS